MKPANHVSTPIMNQVCFIYVHVLFCSKIAFILLFCNFRVRRNLKKKLCVLFRGFFLRISGIGINNLSSPRFPQTSFGRETRGGAIQSSAHGSGNTCHEEKEEATGKPLLGGSSQDS